MAHKELKYDAEARAALQDGVDAVANAVKVTLGLKGRHVVLDKKFGAPTITNDGVTIAREIEIEDVFANQARSSFARSPRRPTTSPATARPRRRCSRRRSSSRASRTSRAPTRSASARGSRRP